MLFLATMVVGFAMMTLGSALLLIGEVPFLAGKRIAARRSRLIGLVLISFLPMSWGVLQAINLIFGPETVEGPVVTSFMFSFCCLVTFVILFRVLVPKREPRKPSARDAGSKQNPFGDTGPVDEPIEDVVEDVLPWTEPEPTPKASAKQSAPKAAQKPPAKKSRKPVAEEENPFDFN